MVIEIVIDIIKENELYGYINYKKGSKLCGKIYLVRLF